MAKVFPSVLVQAFYVTDRPFEGFMKGSDELQEFLQTVVSDVFPDFYYKVHFGDAFMAMVRFLCACMH